MVWRIIFCHTRSLADGARPNQETFRSLERERRKQKERERENKRCLAHKSKYAKQIFLELASSFLHRNTKTENPTVLCHVKLL